jgi:hypothetical protein
MAKFSCWMKQPVFLFQRLSYRKHIVTGTAYGSTLAMFINPTDKEK